jgi:hypothetical protein
MDSDTKTTVGSYVGAAGTILTGVGFLGVIFPPLLIVGGVGAALSAGAKMFTGVNTAGVIPDKM